MVIFTFSTSILAEADYFSPKTGDGIFNANDTRGGELNDYPIVFVYGIAGKFAHWEKTLKTISGSGYYNIGFSPSGKVFHNYHGEKQTLWVWNVSYYTSDIVSESIHGNLKLPPFSIPTTD